MALESSPPIVVAGHIVRNPAAAIMRYLELYGGTVTHYDFRAATFDEVNLDLIRATRSPWMGSRISAQDAIWIIDRAGSAPWAATPRDAPLKNADPLVVDGLYDKATALWDHFWGDRPVNVSTAKISKVLYLMRPHLFPILDSHLISFYRSAARTAAIDVAEKRPSLGRFKTLYWEAIRRDILGNDTALEALRQVLAQAEMKLAHQAGRTLSDLRLLDVLAWAASPEQSAAPRPAPAE